VDFTENNNIIELLNKEFKRRPKPMDILVPAELYSSGLYLFKNGNAMEVKLYGKSA